MTTPVAASVAPSPVRVWGLRAIALCVPAVGWSLLALGIFWLFTRIPLYWFCLSMLPVPALAIFTFYVATYLWVIAAE